MEGVAVKLRAICFDFADFDVEKMDMKNGDVAEVQLGRLMRHVHKLAARRNATGPLLDLVREYRRHHVAYNASDAPDGSDKEVALNAAWRAPYDRLCTASPHATTLDGAIEAIRLVHDEEANCGQQPDLTVNVLRAALAFFDKGGRRDDPGP